MRPLAPLAAVFLVFRPCAAFAWSVHGHEIVALIAQDKLEKESPRTLAAVQNLLAVGLDPSQSAPSMAQVAPCADQIRLGYPVNCAGIHLQGDKSTEDWHFINIPITDAQPAVDKYCKGACVVAQVQGEFATLRDPAASPQAKQLALIYMIHFVGDMHQPLHCAYGIWPDKKTHQPGNDYGGNEEEGKFLGAPLSLHSVWDHLIEPSDLLDPRQTAQALGSGGSGSADDVLSGQAALESFQIARANIYPKFNGGHGSPFGDPGQDDAYQQQEQQVAFDRLELAGARLAALLERALGPQPPAVMAARASKGR